MPTPSTSHPSSAAVPPVWAGLLDDAAVFPPGNAALDDAIDAFERRRSSPHAPLVATLVVKDIDLGAVPAGIPLSVVLTTGAGAVDGMARQAERRGLEIAALEVALRDPDDLPANARRVVAAADAARGEGLVGDDAAVYVELPRTDPGRTDPSPSWLAAADEVAAAELRLKFRTGGVDPDMFPSTGELAAWIDAALDRETPFKCTAGLHHAVRHTASEGFERPVDQHGFLNVLLATRAAFESEGRARVEEVLDTRDAEALAVLALEEPGLDDLARTRRWFTSFGSCSIDEPLDDLLALGLLGGTR